MSLSALSGKDSERCQNNPPAGEVKRETELAQTVTRPKIRISPAEGILRAEHIQVAYVTNDLPRAAEVFQQRYGIEGYRDLETTTPDGGEIAIKLAWVGGTMFELIEAHGAGMEFYNSRLPADEFAIRFHHLGYLTHDLETWNSLGDELARKGLEVVFEGNTEGFLRFVYAHAPEMDHYLEYFLLEDAGVEFFEGVPAS